MPERIALTRAMMESGAVLDWSRDGLNGPVVDKHSTGGVGDKVSLMLGPVAAACGCFVPMISGRGLGHTGGTLDKFDAIPGYQTQPDTALFRRVVREVGCAIIGQTANLAPADRRLYAIRDVTATVESIPLITASILSKKLAVGAAGPGDGCEDRQRRFHGRRWRLSRELADSIVRVASGAGVKTTALITDMNQVLGHAAGHTTEMREAIDYLTGKRREARLDAGDARPGGGDAAGRRAVPNCAGGACPGSRRRCRPAARRRSSAAWWRRSAARPICWSGRAPIWRRPRSSSRARPTKSGRIAAIDTRAVGVALIELGGGRLRAQDKIDHRVGFSDFRGLGEEVGPQTADLHHSCGGRALPGRGPPLPSVSAVRLTAGGVAVPSPIHERIAVD